MVGKYWKSCKTAKIGHSEIIQTTSVAKYWKSCKTVKIGHSESIQPTFGRKIFEKVAKQPILAIMNHLGPLWWEKIGKCAE